MTTQELITMIQQGLHCITNAPSKDMMNFHSSFARGEASLAFRAQLITATDFNEINAQIENKMVEWFDSNRGENK